MSTMSECVEVVMLGAGGVGKSCLTLRYMYNQFVEEYEPTKTDAYQRSIDLGNKEYQISITDTAGQESYRYIKDDCIRRAHGFFCIFSVTDRESFETVDDYIHSIIRIKDSEKLDVILVGNKIDLVSTGQETRAISREEAEEKANHYHIAYVETSAKENLNVKEMFIQLVKNVTCKYVIGYDVKPPVEKKRNCCCTII